MWRIGLTGGIGSGKSTVARMLARRGAHLIDTDEITRSLTLAHGAAMPALQAAFGTSVIDEHGALDRAKMRQLAFADPQAKQVLESILHPLIRAQVDVRESAAVEASARVLVFDVPLLVESGRWRERLDRVWLVDCHEDTQVHRVTGRPGWTGATARAVLAQQATRRERRACADAVLFNDALDLQALAAQVQRLWAQLCARPNVSADTNEAACP